MEKNIDIVIGHRFEKKGMSWTTEGANNLARLRTLWHNQHDWEAFWRKQSSRGVSFSANQLTQPDNRFDDLVSTGEGFLASWQGRTW
jgi:hypothetical protein